MDNRRQMVGYLRKGKKEPSQTFGLALLFYVALGGSIAFAMYIIPSFIHSMLVFFTYIMVMISMTLITDFSAILLDTSDNTIILPRPVDSRTLFAARQIHILLYLGQMAVALSVIPATVVFVTYGGMVFTLFLVMIFLSILTAVFLTNGLYLLIMQFATEDKLKTIINYFQIVMAIVIMAGYQLLPRLTGRIDIKTFVFQIEWWSFLLPPVWMAGTLEAFKYERDDSGYLMLIACAFVLPLLGMFIVNKYLSPLFHKKIASLTGGIDRREQTKSEKQSDIIQKIAKWITNTPAEHGAFHLIYKILGRDRKIKLKVYPSFGYVAVFGLIFMLRSQEDFATTWSNLPNTQYYLLLLYLTFMVLQVAWNEIPYSDDFKASWIYHAAPLNVPGEILTGSIKAICVRLFFPSFVVISAFVLFIWGYKVIDDIAIALFNNLIMIMGLAMINLRHIPFSIAPNLKAQSGNVMRSMLTALAVGALGLSHYLLSLLSQRSAYLLGVVPIQMVVLYIMFRKFKKTSWSQITL